MVKYRDGERMLDALGLPIRRAMVRRLQKRGAMSLSKLAEPYDITLPATLKHVRLLEDTGIVTTHKRGRVRICVYNPSAFKELSSWLASQSAFWESSFDRLERTISKSKSRKRFPAPRLGNAKRTFAFHSPYVAGKKKK